MLKNSFADADIASNVRITWKGFREAAAIHRQYQCKGVRKTTQADNGQEKS